MQTQSRADNKQYNDLRSSKLVAYRLNSFKFKLFWINEE